MQAPLGFYLKKTFSMADILLMLLVTRAFLAMTCLNICCEKDFHEYPLLFRKIW